MSATNSFAYSQNRTVHLSLSKYGSKSTLLEFFSHVYFKNVKKAKVGLKTYGMEEHALSKVPRTLSSVGMVILHPTNEFTGWFILVESEGHDFSYLMQFKRFVITFQNNLTK
jgi:hypothetical protein